jgi:hypothetical protein
LLLLDVARHASPLRVSAPALADDASHLHQRILALAPRVPRFAHVRGGLAAAFALAGVLIACEARLPSEGAPERTERAPGSFTTLRVPLVRGGARTPAGDRLAPLIVIDGARSTESRLRPLDPKTIEKVDVYKGPAARQHYGDSAAVTGVIEITTKRSGTK